MPIPAPTFDSRNYREILNEALSRIPVHTPEWTNFNEADPGVTLLQLFAFMTESLIYRANLIPERNRRKYLRLLGIPMQAAAAARGLVVIQNSRGPLQTTTLDADQQVLAGKVPFRTQNGLDVLPVETRLFYKGHLAESRQSEIEELYQRLYASFDTLQTELRFYETIALASPRVGAPLPLLDLREDTVDGVAWLAIIARVQDSRSPEDLNAVRDAIANRVLTLGVLPAPGEDGCALFPSGTPVSGQQPNLIVEIPNTDDQRARYERLSITADDDPLRRPALVQVQLPASGKLDYWTDLSPIDSGTGEFPPSLEDTDVENRLITWLRVRTVSDTADDAAASAQTRARISWMGINAARVEQRAQVHGEVLLAGTGAPNQIVTLVNTPVIESTVQLFVGAELWMQTDDLSTAAPEVESGTMADTLLSIDSSDVCLELPVLAPDQKNSSIIASSSSKIYTVDRESGEIRFGDGAHGSRPPLGISIKASYSYGGGLAGMTGIGAIQKAPMLNNGLTVTNPLPTWGGDEAETVDEAERAIPAVLRHRERLVSKQDYEEITHRTPGVDIGRLEVLPTVHPEVPAQLSEGAVSVVVLPKTDSLHPLAPRPNRLFLETICAHLEPRRIVTTELYVIGPVYRSLWVSVGFDVVPGRDLAPVRAAIEEQIRFFLSPFTGGFEERGWPLGKAVEALELWATATRVDGVSKVNAVRLSEATGTERDRIELGALELPELVNVVAEAGDPPVLSEIIGTVETETSGTAGEVSTLVPVPVVPEEC